MSYNIRYYGGEDVNNPNHWEKRKANLFTTIKFQRADIIGFQEVLSIQFNEFQKEFTEFAWYGIGRDDGKTEGEYAPIFFNKAKYLLLDSSTFWLSETPNEVSRGWDAACNRIVSWVKLKDKLTGNEFYYFNTHFDHIGKDAQRESAKLIVENVNRITGDSPFFISGDFNFTSYDYSYKYLTQFYNDAQTAVINGHYGGNQTYNEFGNVKDVNRKIDYIFVKKNIKVINHGVIGVKYNDRYPSDHMPVVADIKLGD